MVEVGEVGSLGLKLEADSDIQDQGRFHKQMTQWPSEDTEGVPSCPAIACNLRLLLLVIEWWAHHSNKPRPIPIDIVKREAWGA